MLEVFWTKYFFFLFSGSAMMTFYVDVWESSHFLCIGYYVKKNNLNDNLNRKKNQVDSFWIKVKIKLQQLLILTITIEFWPVLKRVYFDLIS